jgi:hypothetical protein
MTSIQNFPSGVIIEYSPRSLVGSGFKLRGQAGYVLHLCRELTAAERVSENDEPMDDSDDDGLPGLQNIMPTPKWNPDLGWKIITSKNFKFKSSKPKDINLGAHS